MEVKLLQWETATDC